MAEVNLKLSDNVYTPQVPAYGPFNTGSGSKLFETGSDEAAYMQALYASNNSPGVWDVSVYLWDGITQRFLCRNFPLKASGKSGNCENLLRGVPITIGELQQVWLIVDAGDYHGASGTGVSPYALCPWVKITPAP